jgi:type IV pilus assembly protein PilF
MRLALAGLLVVVLAACASSPDRSEESARKAAETNTALGRSYLERGQYEIALEKLKRAVAHDKTYSPAHTLLGVLYETIGEYDEAEREYRKAVQYDATDGDVNNNLGAFLCGHGKRAEAEKYFRVAVDDPFYGTPEVALSNAGSCALAAGDLDKAETFLRQSLAVDEKLASALLPMAELSYRQESYLKARAFLQRYEEVAPDTEESLLLGYRIESRLGDEKTAERYRAALSQQYPDAMGAGGTAGQEKE